MQNKQLNISKENNSITSKDNNHSEIIIDKGDLVFFFGYGIFYVNDPCSYKNVYWCTPNKADRYDSNAPGRSIPKDSAVRIIEKGKA